MARKKKDNPKPDERPVKRRSRLPVNAFFRFDESLAANPNHPLGMSSPEHREASRLRLIASILARLAGGGMQPAR